MVSRSIREFEGGGGFEVTPAEATFLKQTIRDIFNENDKIEEEAKKSGKETMDLIFTYPEIFERFFWHYYGINLHEYLRHMPQNDQKKARLDLYKYVQEKLRKDMELI